MSINLQKVQRSDDGCDMRRFRSFNHRACKTGLNLLEAIYLRLRKIVEWATEAAMALAAFYPRDAMLARVIAIATCLSVRLSVRHAPVLCQNEES